jgi:hypothetical protein
METARPIFSIDFTAEPRRKCGDCTLCCRLLPVLELKKIGGQRCKHQRHGKGCTVYHQPKRGFPPACALWSCVWLSDPDAAGGMRRPDRTHYVVDIMPDFVVLKYDHGHDDHRVNVVQVWVDPAYPEAHRDPALRAYLAMRGEEDGMAALIRYSETEAWVLFPPALTPDGKWHERGSSRDGRDKDQLIGPHTAKEIFGV